MIVVTGGAGFIGANLVEYLLSSSRYEGEKILVVDNLSAGSLDNLPKDPRVSFAKLDINSPLLVKKLEGAKTVFHFAADPSVADSIEPKKSFDENVNGSFNVLEACRKNNVKQFVFASTSTVYGEALVRPTPETYPCEPISNYGASKLACEAYVSSFAHSYGIKSTILRYANIFGPLSNHGVMPDFASKLKENPRELSILGDGKQNKSYLYISDCISGTLTACEKQTKICDFYNVGSESSDTVDTIAKYVSESMGVSPKFVHSGGDRGWKGDVPLMLLDITKLKKLGWKPKVSLKEGVRSYVNWLSSK